MELAVNNNETRIVAHYWEMLRPLSMKAKLRLATLLTSSVFEEESLKEEPIPQKRRTARVIRHAENIPSDAELEARFNGKDMPETPPDPSWNHVIDSNTGKTIKPIEKWL